MRQPRVGHPWLVHVDHGEAVLDCDWPDDCPTRVLRGAIAEQMGGGDGRRAHVDWHNHADGEEVRHATPRVLYRVTRGRPVVYAWGSRAHEQLTEIARVIHALRLPGGRVLDVRGVSIDVRQSQANATAKTWHRYILASPLFPPDVAWARRPRRPGPEREAWAGHLVARSIASLLCEMGLEARRHIHVRLSGYRDVRVCWERPEQGRRIERWGFSGWFVTNARLPDGIGLGRHRSEGFGEIRHA